MKLSLLAISAANGEFHRVEGYRKIPRLPAETVNTATPSCSTAQISTKTWVLQCHLCHKFQRYILRCTFSCPGSPYCSLTRHPQIEIDLKSENSKICSSSTRRIRRLGRMGSMGSLQSIMWHDWN